MTNLRIFREKLKISQKELAKHVNVSQPLLCQVERGDRRPWPALLRRASKALKIPYSALEPDLKWERGITNGNPK